MSFRKAFMELVREKAATLPTEDCSRFYYPSPQPGTMEHARAQEPVVDLAWLREVWKEARLRAGLDASRPPSRNDIEKLLKGTFMRGPRGYALSLDAIDFYLAGRDPHMHWGISVVWR
jgi:hypothetical protein